MDSHLYRIACSAAPTALAVALLSACGGGGGGAGMVRSDPPVPVTVPQPDPDPDPSAMFATCEGPQASDCVVHVPENYFGHPLTGDRDSDHALLKRGKGGASLIGGTFRFGGGTSVEEGVLLVDATAALVSDVDVAEPGRFFVYGDVQGDVVNRGSMGLYGSIDGDLTNAGGVEVGSSIWGDEVPAFISGDFVQTATGAMSSAVGATTGGVLTITGQARLAGALYLSPYSDGWSYYPIPATPFSHHVLTAGGGVSGTFDSVYHGMLFVEGALRYESNDVWFDATRLSAQSVMQGAGAGDAMTQQAAAAFDRVLAIADTMPRDVAQLSDAQRRFLQSAATIQRIGDYAQAVRTFDSLSGHGHLGMIHAQLQHALASAPRVGAHAEGVPLRASGAWTGAPDVASVGGAAFMQGQAFGYDAWIGERLLLSGRFDQTDSEMALSRDGGVAHGHAPAVHVSLHRVGPNGWHATGLLGASRQTTRIERPIELGAARGAAISQRDADLAYAWVEAGRSFRTPVGMFVPTVSLGYAAIHGDAFVEQGNTGFELAAMPSRHERVQGDAGVRWSKGWRWGADGWAHLGMGTRWRHAFVANDALQAAFAGAPEVVFDLAGMPMARTDHLWELDFTGGAGERWKWSLRYEDGADDRALSLGMAFGW